MRPFPHFFRSRSRVALLLATVAAALLFVAAPLLLLLLGPVGGARAQSAPPAAPTATPPPADAQNANLLDDAWEAAHGFELPAFRYNALAGWWLFDDGTANDKSAFHLDGTLFGFVPLTLSPPQSPFVEGGLFYGALAFDEQAFVSFDPARGPDLSGGSFTLSAWFKAPAPSAGVTPNPSVIAHWAGTNGAAWELGVDERSAAYLDLTGPGAATPTQRVDRVNAPTLVRDGAWHHLAGVYDAPSATATLYVAGAPEAAATVPGGWTGAPAAGFRLGYPGTGLAAAPNAPFTLDEVRLYNQAIAAADIRRLPPTFYDLDGDGLSTLAEMRAGTDPNVADSDGDGIPDGAEAYPLDFYNAALPTLALAGGDGQIGPRGAFLPQALAVRVTNSGGQTLANAPVIFTVAGGGDDARLALAAGASPPPAGAAGASVTARTGADGLARAYLFLPADTTLAAHGATAAATVTGGQSAAVAFGASVQPVAPVSDGLTLWLAADLGVTTDAGGRVSAWTDLSGAQDSAAQADANSQPQRLANQLGGRPVLRFDGGSNSLIAPVSPGTDDFTVFAVARATTTRGGDTESTGSTSGVSGQRYLFGARQSGADGGAGVSLGTNGVSVYEHGDSYLSPLAVYAGNVGAGFNSVAVRYTAKQPQIFVNGALVRTGLTSQRPHVHAPVQIGAGQYGAFPGDVAEVLVYGRALSDAECAQVETYLNAKYAYNPPPAVPAQLSAVPLSATQVALAWAPGTGGGSVTAYALERQTNGGAWTVLATLGGGVTSYVDAGLGAGATYAYRLTAANSAGTSPASANAVTTTQSSGGAFPIGGLQLWLRADAGVNADTVGLVSVWADQSPANHSATQTNPNNQPRWLGGQINGQPAVHFDGNAAFFNLPGSMGTPTGGDLFVVHRATGTVDQPYPHNLYTSFHHLGTGGYSYYPYRDTNYPAATGGIFDDFGSAQVHAVGKPAQDLTQFHLYEALSSPTEWTARLNGRLQFSTPTNTVSFPATPQLGVYNDDHHFAGDIAEVLIYGRALSDAERQAVEVYLNAKYAVVVAPAAPAGLVAAPISSSQTSLLWGSPADASQVEGWSVERRDPASGLFTPLASVAGGGALAYLDGDLTPGASYLYRVRAYNLAGFSPYSEEVSVTLPASLPATATLPATDALALWLKADAGISADANGLVSAWTDVSGHGMNAAPPAPANAPRRVDAQANGRPVLNFDGASGYLQLPAGLDDFSAGLTALVVTRPTGVGSWQRFFDFGNGAGADNVLLCRYGGGADLNSLIFIGGGLAANLNAPAAIEQNKVQLFELEQGAGTLGFYKNGDRLVQGGSPSPRVITRQSNLIGKSNWGGDALFQGDIAEVLLFDRALTDAERQGWEGYLNAKYQYDPPPPAPTAVTATALSGTQIALAWTENFANVSGYTVERQTAGGAWMVLARPEAGITSYVDASVIPGTAYAYRVTATNRAGASPASAPAPALTPGPGGADLPVANLRLWLRADTGLTTDTAGAVSRWTDQSGGGHHAGQNDPNQRPLPAAGSINGGSVLHFDGANQVLWLPNCLGDLTAGDFFVVQRVSSDRDGAGAYNGAHRLGNFPYGDQVQYPGGDGAIRDDFGSTQPHVVGRSGPALDGFHLYEAVSSPSEWTSRVNGVLHFSTPVNTVSFPSNPAIGADYYHFKGDVAEVLLFDRVLTPAEREAVGRYLNRRHALVAATPDAPSALQAQTVSATQVNLSWTAPAQAAAGTTVYRVERRAAGGTDYAFVAEVVDVANYLDANLAPATAYTYRVSARNYAGVSAPSGEASAQTPGAAAPGAAGMPLDGLQLWLRADGVAGAAGAAVGTWADQSGRGHHACAAGGGEPTLVTGALNGRSVVRFDGVSSALTLPDFMAGFGQGDFFVVQRVAADRSGAGAYNGAHRLGSFPYSDQVQYPAGDGAIRDDFGSTSVHYTSRPVAPIGGFHLYEASSQPGEWTNRINGVLHFTTTSNAVAFPHDPRLGSNYYRFGGDVAEVLVYDHVLASAEREAVGRYLNAKYALAAVPPAPANLVALAISPTQAVLTWGGSPNGSATVYTVERRTPGGEYAVVAEVENATSYLDQGLTASAAYVYRVRARSYAGASLPSNEATLVNPQSQPLAAMPTAGLKLWLAADAVPAAGGVDSMTDLSGSGNHAHAEGGSLPTLVPNAANGRSVVRFNGSSDQLTLPDFMGGLAAGDVFIVQRAAVERSTSGAYNGAHRLGSFPYNDQVQYPAGDGRIFDDFGSASVHYTPPLPVATSDLHLYEAASSPAGWTSRVNGMVHFDTRTNTVAFPHDPRLGSNYYRFGGDVAEVLVYDHVLASAEREAVGRYLNAKYALAAVPPVPTGLSATTVSSTQVALVWSAGPATATSVYTVERRAAGETSFSLVAEVENATAFLDNTAAAGTAYAYRVSARTYAGASAPSEEAAANTPPDDTSLAAMPTAGLKLWLAADALPTNAAKVDAMTDLSGSGNHAHAENGSDLPTRVTAALNGRPAVRFNNNSASLVLPDFMASFGQGDFFIVQRVAAEHTGGSASFNGAHRLGSFPYNDQVQYPAGNGAIYDDFGSASVHSTGRSALPLDQFHLYEAASSPTEWTNRINGEIHFSTKTNTVAFPHDPRLGLNCYHFCGDVAEVLVYDHLLPKAERDAVGRYLTAKYALAVIPAAPTGLVARAVSGTQISLSWAATNATATVYTVERRMTGDTGPFLPVAQVDSATGYLDDGLSPGVAYTYRVSARDYAGTSGCSNEASATCRYLDPALVLPTAALRLWLAADALPTQPGGVDAWADLSGGGNHARNEAGGTLPSLVPDAVNGRPAVHFDGASSPMLLPNFMGAFNAGDLFVVQRSSLPSGQPNAGFSGGHRLGSFPYNDQVQYPAGDGRIFDDFGSASVHYTDRPTANDALDQFHLYEAASSTTEWTNRINGHAHYTTATNTVAFPANPQIGANCYPFKGDVAEVLLFDRVLTPTERRLVEWYLAAKYLISGYDLIGDGLTTAQRLALGLDPFTADSNGDGLSDVASLRLGLDPRGFGGFDYHSLPNPTGSGGPGTDPADHTPPVITLTAPADAVPLP